MDPYLYGACGIWAVFPRRSLRKRLGEDLGFNLKILGKAIYEGRQILECSELVKVTTLVSHIGWNMIVADLTGFQINHQGFHICYRSTRVIP